ncbi:glycosyltransferase [Maribacter algicola]|uniref:Glycosyltransferase n=1 Tax=Meishania litoralis TaxID=3434685 RepID=A0ACC7LN31_9FLAO
MPGTGFIWQKGIWKLAFKPYKHYILSSSSGYLANWILALFAIIQGKKVYSWTHGIKGNNTRVRMFMEKNFYKLCHKVFLYGNQGKENMIQAGFSPDKLVLVYNSLDYEKQLAVRQTLKPSQIFMDHFGNDLPVILYIGRIQKSKKVDLLIEALKNSNAQKKFYNLVIVGKDVENNDIPKLVEKYGLNSQVWFYGPCYDEEEIGPLLYNSDACVSPGLIGLTAIHSLTYGTPVITSNDFISHGPEFEAIEEGVTGSFFEEGNVENLCLKLSEWTNLSQKEREKSRLNAYRIIEEKYNAASQIKTIKETLALR